MTDYGDKYFRVLNYEGVEEIIMNTGLIHYTKYNYRARDVIYLTRINKLKQSRKTIKRDGYTAMLQAIIDVVINNNLAVKVYSSKPIGEDIYIMVEEHQGLVHVMLQNRKIVLQFKKDYPHDLVFHDATFVTQGVLEELRHYINKFATRNKNKRDKREAERKLDANKTEEMNDVLKRKYEDYDKIEYDLLQNYDVVLFKGLGIQDSYYLTKIVHEAHQLMNSVIKLSLYPKLKYLTLRNPTEHNWGYFYHDLGIQLRLFTKDPTQKADLYLTYFHEYGHYIHYYLTKVDRINRVHNTAVFNDMVKEFRKTETIKKLRDKYSPERMIRTREGITYKKELSTHGRYLVKGTEIIARAFESYCFRKLNIQNLVGTSNNLTKGALFTEEECQIFVKYMSRLKL